MTGPVHTSEAFELEPADLRDYAWRLAKFGVEGEGATVSATWDALAFQVEGQAQHLSTRDVHALLRAFSVGGALSRNGGACRALQQAMCQQASGTLRAYQVVSLWVALDRANVIPEAAATVFFRDELRRALPLVLGSPHGREADGAAVSEPLQEALHAAQSSELVT